MGGLLPGKEMDQINTLFAEHVYNIESPIVYFPVRHHSPACSYHLIRTIEAYQPDVILLEGPENSNHLIEILTDERTQPPVGIYYGYAAGEHTYTCCYPFLAYSPEYVALKEARARGIDAAFIDVSYGSRIESLAPGHGLKKENEKLSYHDETMLASSLFMQRLCEKMNCRNFDELWERVFEIGGLQKSTPDFVRDVFAYCFLSRKSYTDEQLEADGHFLRESRMRAHIDTARKTYSRILVITGGFHTYGLIEERPFSARIHKAAGEQVYPIVYTFAEADARNGYASGMPFVQYYDAVWQEIQRGEKEPYTKSGVLMLAQVLKKLREKGDAVSVADAIEANGLSSRLARLRAKREGGAYELLDAVTSAFTKGERSVATSRPLDTLHELMTGDKIGEIAPNNLDIPLVRHFKERCRAYRLPLNKTGTGKKTLDLYAKPSHREQSRFFHQVHFLATGFCEKEAGPDWVAGRHTNLVREIWSYRYTSVVEAHLIENSVYGGTIKEAALSKMEDIIKQIPPDQSHETARWLLQAAVMGLEEVSSQLLRRLEQAIERDRSFLSLCQTAHLLSFMYEQKRLLALRGTFPFERLLVETYGSAVRSMSGLAKPHPDEIGQIVENIKLLYAMTSRKSLGLPGDLFAEQLETLLMMPDLPPRLEGGSAAVLFNLHQLTREDILKRARAYIFGTPANKQLTALYLQGVFSVARDIFLYDEQVLTDLDHLITSLDYEDFLQVIPELKLAFTYFSPAEIQTIAGKVAGLYQTTEEDVTGAALDETMLRKAGALDRAIREEFTRWNLM